MRNNMRYLKKYNESLDQNELKEFCEGCLAYLTDDLNLTVEPAYKQEGVYEINLYHETKRFSWQKIKDYYIPFIQLLANRYELVTLTGNPLLGFVVKIADDFSGYYHYTYEDIINDWVGVTHFNSISVYVTDK
jgi:hypothetical protein